MIHSSVSCAHFPHASLYIQTTSNESEGSHVMAACNILKVSCGLKTYIPRDWDMVGLKCRKSQEIARVQGTRDLDSSHTHA